METAAYLSDSNNYALALFHKEDGLLLVVGNIPTKVAEAAHELIDREIREVVRDVERVATVPGSVAGRSEVHAHLGPYQTKFALESAKRHVLRFIKDNLGGSPNQLQ